MRVCVCACVHVRVCVHIIIWLRIIFLHYICTNQEERDNEK